MQLQNVVFNWRGAGINPFESFWSIGQKWSYLNEVKFDVFLKTVNKCELRSNGAISISEAETKADALSHLLHLPIENFAFCHHDAFLPRIPVLFRRGSPDGIDTALRWCPRCIDRGFHSPVHQLSFLSGCLIHGHRLVKQCPTCGRVLSYLNRALPMISRYHCVCGRPMWDIAAPVWPSPYRHSQLAPMIEYLKWVRDVEREAVYPGTDPGVHFFSDDRPRQLPETHRAWWLRCISSIVRPTNALRRAFPGRPVSPTRLELVSADADRDLTLVLESGYRELLAFCVAIDLDSSSRSSWYRFIARALKEILGAHKPCLAYYQMAYLAALRSRVSLPDDRTPCSRAAGALCFSTIYGKPLRELQARVEADVTQSVSNRLRLMTDKTRSCSQTASSHSLTRRGLLLLLWEMWRREVMRAADACLEDPRMTNPKIRPFPGPSTGTVLPFVVLTKESHSGLAANLWTQRRMRPRDETAGVVDWARHRQTVEEAAFRRIELLHDLAVVRQMQ